MKKWMKQLGILVVTFCTAWMLWGMDVSAVEREMYCLYNAANREYLYTIDANEKDTLMSSWQYLGVVCTLPETSDTPVYRLYDPVSAQHLYTSDQAEITKLVGEGWTKEGVAYYVDDHHTKTVYRLFNTATGEHMFSGSETSIAKHEADGWKKEGVAYYALSVRDTVTGKSNGSAAATGKLNRGTTQDLQMVEGVDYSEWTQRQTWTASNGVTLKIKDGVDLGNILEGRAAYVITDGDTHPDSSYSKALHEFIGMTYLDDTSSELPVINNSSVKRTSFPNNDPVFLDYQSKANRTLRTLSPATGGCVLTSDSSEVRVIDGMKDYWSLSYSGSYWMVKIYRNMPVAVWNCLRDCLKLVSPDGQLLYDVLYTDFFEGSDYIEDYDMWCPVGSSEIYQIDPSTYNVALYRFR